MGVLYSVSSGFEILSLSGAIGSGHQRLESMWFSPGGIGGDLSDAHHKKGVC